MKIDNKKYFTKWYISEMELWSEDYINEEVKGYISLDKNNTGEFHFGYVHGFMDCEYITKDNNTLLEFSWDGNDEMDNVNGRGYAIIENDILVGKIFIHNGDSSEFKALKKL